MSTMICYLLQVPFISFHSEMDFKYVYASSFKTIL